MNKQGKAAQGIWITLIIIGVLLALGMLLQKNYPLFSVIGADTNMAGHCSDSINDKTFGANNGQCYLYTLNNAQTVMYVNAIWETSNSANAFTCHYDVSGPITTAVCADNKVFTAPGVTIDYCDSNADCNSGANICTNHFCTDRPVGTCNNPGGSTCFTFNQQNNQYQTCGTNGLLSGVLTCGSGLICSAGNCITPPVTCTSFTYSNFAGCQSNNLQYRDLLSASPTGCTGGTRVLSQSCTYVPPLPACTSANYLSALSPTVCPVNQQQTKTYTKIGNCDGTTPNAETVGCTYTNPVLPDCVYTYTGFGTCSSTGTQTRTVTNAPTNCNGGPVLSQSCTPIVAQVNCTSFTYGAFSPAVCDSTLIQTRALTSSSPTGCTGGTPILTQACTVTPAAPLVCTATQMNIFGNCFDKTFFYLILGIIGALILFMMVKK